MIFLAHAAAIAESDSIETIYIGSNLQDAAGTPLQGAIGQPRGGYPDSGSEFLQAAEVALNKGLKYINRLRIRAPLLAMSKFEAIRFGYDHHFDFRSAWSCYKNGTRACGKCSACRARLLNFHWAGLVDPSSYEIPYNTALMKALDVGTSSFACLSQSGSSKENGSTLHQIICPEVQILPNSAVLPISDVIAGIQTTSPNARRITLQDPVINRTPKRARQLAAAYRRQFSKKGVPILRAQWLPGGPYTCDVLHLLRHVKDLRIDFQTPLAHLRGCNHRSYSQTEYEETLAKLRRFSIRATLNIYLSLPNTTEAALKTLTHAYRLGPSRVSIAPFDARVESRFLRSGLRQIVSSTESQRLWQICQVSADSYNYWKQLQETRVRRDIDCQGCT